MESRSGNGTSTNLKTSPSTNSSENELSNSKKKQELSQDRIHLSPNATATTTTATPRNDQTNSSVIEKRSENSINSHLEANHANPFGEFYPTYPNASDPSSLSSSSSQNPFLLLNDDDTINIKHVNANESQNLHDQVPFEPRLHQSSTQGNPFQVPTSTINDDSQKIVEHHDHGNASSNTNKDSNVHPKSGKDSHLTAKSSHDNASSKTEKDTNVDPKSEKDFHVTVESSDNDIPISSMPKHGQQSTNAVAVSDTTQKPQIQTMERREDPSSTNAVAVPETIQNPPIQVMERQEDPSTSSTNRIPLHVFERDKSNTQWSTASNDSLFSIQLGNMSFSNDMWWSKSDELDKQADHTNNADKQADHTNNASRGFQSNHLPPLSPPQSTKFNDINHTFAEQHEDSLKVAEAKAAETMREVIMETSTRPKNNKSNGDLKFDNAAPHSNILLPSFSYNDNSPHPDGSTKSFAFKV
ncbi:hypothetical protein TSUD_122110 [Trifolium subterraneum]|nr:hypothetical protein TSUD_122110 [Trifolium subterraneum]